MKTNQTLKEVLMEVWNCGYTIDTPDTQGMSVDQALKEIEQLLVECKPEKKKLYEAPTNSIENALIGYNSGIDDYEKNIKAIL
ncbi:MAG: hypothetical protein QG623_724 [Patescibacteria group bacterium]|nr:hypothetical protein [Patescibacteria group bacterium]